MRFYSKLSVKSHTRLTQDPYNVACGPRCGRPLNIYYSSHMNIPIIYIYIIISKTQDYVTVKNNIH